MNIELPLIETEHNYFKRTIHHDVDDDEVIFRQLHEKLMHQCKYLFPDKIALKTVVIIPSLTLDQEILGKVKGHIYYEERLLCMLMLLRMPHTHVIYITSVPVDPVIVDYYLHLLPGITGYHARQRLTMLSCYDYSWISLTEKILKRPRLINRIRMHIPQIDSAHMVCFNVTQFEKELAIKLGIPLNGCHPKLLPLGTKTGSRLIFKDCNILTPLGFDDVKSFDEIINALAQLKKNNPALRKAVVKMNDGFSGEGNAVFYYKDIKVDENLIVNIKLAFNHNIKIVAKGLSIPTFINKFESDGGVVEEFVEGDFKASPSVQCRINPLQQIEVLSTHDQMLGGENDQVFIGAFFPANKEYVKDISEAGIKIAEYLSKYGVVGRFSVDFISVKEKGEWKNYAIEINLRKGGTTHPYQMLQFLTNGNYNYETGEFYTEHMSKRYYFSSDNVYSEKYIGLAPHDLIEIATTNDIMYNSSRETGVMFHMIGALSQYGKLGVVCIGVTSDQAYQFYEETLRILDKECS